MSIWDDDDVDEAVPLRQRRRLLSRELTIGLRRTLCGVEWVEPYWVSEPTRPFRAQGLIVVRAPVGTRLVEWRVGTELALPFSRQPLVLSVFNVIENDEKTRPQMPSCGPGMLMRLRLDDGRGAPVDPASVELAIWGITPISI